MTDQRGFQTFDHTADLGLAAWGPDLATALEQAGAGLQSIIVAGGRIRPTRRREFAVDAPDPAALAVAWLNELIFVFDVEAAVFATFAVTVESPTSLRAVALGEGFNADRHDPGIGVKAATYHDLHLDVSPGRVSLRVILDV